jgi:hypothetical protein
MSEESEIEGLEHWYCLWSGCDFFPDEQEGIACAFCDRSIGEYREEGIDSVEILWIDKDSLRHLDIPSWQNWPPRTSFCVCGAAANFMTWASGFLLGKDRPTMSA